MRPHTLITALWLIVLVAACTAPAAAPPPAATETLSPLASQLRGQWTCDGGPDDVMEAARAARDQGDHELAWWLAARAEVTCLGNPERFAAAARLRQALASVLEANPVPGLVQVGSLEALVTCLGEGRPLVVFGGIAPRNLQPAVSTVTRTCRYEYQHPGLASRLPAGAVPSAADYVQAQAEVLQAAGIEPPYVLVGHSGGGFILPLYVHQFPDQVAGLVLVDAMHPDWPANVAVADPAFDFAASAGGAYLDIPASLEQLTGMDDVGSRPLAVVSDASDAAECAQNPAGMPFNEAACLVWTELQHDYETYSTHSRYFHADGGTHLIPDHRPDTIIAAILWVVDEVRASLP